MAKELPEGWFRGREVGGVPAGRRDCVRRAAAGDFDAEPPTFQVLTDTSQDGLAVLTPLAGPAALITAIAPDGLRLRHLLNTAHSAHLSL